jgi:hypothetical protein
MKVTRASLFALMPLIGAAALTPGASAASEYFAKSGFLRVTKECSGFTGDPGSFCEVTSSSTPAIPVGSKIYYGQPGGLPGVGLDSNVVLDGGDGNRAVGRCTLDFSTGTGLCTFSDGTGKLAGFTARVDVSTKDGLNWQWLGTYEFESLGIGWPLPRH